MENETEGALARRDRLLGEARVLGMCAMEKIKEAGYDSVDAAKFCEWYARDIFKK